MAFNYADYKRCFREAARAKGIDPECGSPLDNHYVIANAKAEGRKRRAMQAADRGWWRQGDLWSEWITVENVKRSLENDVLEELCYLTNPQMKRPETDDEQTERLHGELAEAHHMPLKEVHERRGVEYAEMNFALPDQTPQTKQMFLPLPGQKHANLTTEADYVPLDISKRLMRRKRAWKDGKIAVERFVPR